jgi:hypothetical protein
VRVITAATFTPGVRLEPGQAVKLARSARESQNIRKAAAESTGDGLVAVA